MSGGLVRSFVCIPLPEAVKRIVGDRAAAIRREHSGLKWVEKELYHITLRFCGEHPLSVLEEFRKNAETALSGNRPGPVFLRLGQPGAFPGMKRARTFFIGIEGETEKLARIAELIESAAAAAGMGKENRSFHPHVTLARARQSEEIVPPSFQVERSGEWSAKNILWMKSELRPSGPEYFLLQEWSLL
ncbi:MAG: RNA 2',3'-cyclic phosphodiesterase [Aminivibrio sp.]|jgi:2'-5' RNA ligase|nr:RNA 2',3'-cyclic phosphodiesterase [Aminivibrio sp.]